MQKKHRIIIDTNLWISFLLTKKFAFLDKLMEKNKVRLLFSQELFDEFLEVIKRPKLQKFFSGKDVILLLEIINQYADIIEVKSKISICRDEKDNFLLALAKDGSANFLITGDKDLLVIKRFEKTEIITIAAYKLI